MVSDEKNTDPVEDDDEDSEGGFEVGRDNCLQFAGLDKLCQPSDEVEMTPGEMLEIVQKHHE